ncbi:MAG: hypothetical protein JNM10_05000 [Planctomycetia bacterium]|nr:hypothetical protein [Planctomycetia bacterium]
MNLFQRWRLRSLVSASRTEDASSYLRSLGLSEGDSTIALRAAEIRTGAAKRAIHESPVWCDRYAADAAFHESLERAVDDLARTERTQVPTTGRVSDDEIDVQHEGVSGLAWTRRDLATIAAMMGDQTRPHRVIPPDRTT